MQTIGTDLNIASPDDERPGDRFPAYEFNSSQNQLLARLTGTMRIVGVTTSILGLGLIGVGVLLAIKLGTPLPAPTRTSWLVNAWPTALPGVLFLIIGTATLRASRDFAAITRTRGQDMPLLMGALDALTLSYRTQLWFASLGAIVAGMLVASFIYV